MLRFSCIVSVLVLYTNNAEASPKLGREVEAVTSRELNEKEALLES